MAKPTESSSKLIQLPQARSAQPPKPGGDHDARFIHPDVVYHCILRTVRGTYLLRPDRAGQVEQIIGGVMKRAKELYPDVEVFSDAWLSNHAHLLVRGPPKQIPFFIGFLKREVSRRLSKVLGWSDGIFRRGYNPTALLSPQSQRNAQTYVLSQGVKENLVQRPQQWPGTHSAKELSTGKPRYGIWFDGTGYARAKHKYHARVQRGKPPNPRDFEHKTEFLFDRLPALQDLSDKEHQAYINLELEKIVQTAADTRRATGKKILGRRAVYATSPFARSELPEQPPHEKRRRMIIWDDRRCPEARAYLEQYRRFQDAYRRASKLFRDGNLNAVFPPGAFRPPSFAVALAA
ncbi:MAG: hypothetical protein VCC00_08025 [Deltaproteobacteria bacterium]